MRILHCTHSIDCGGLQRQLSYLASELTRKGYDVHVAYLRGNFFAEKLTHSGVILHHIRNICDFHPRIRVGFSLLDPTVLTQLNQLIKKLKPDLIQTWFREMDIPGGILASKNKIPWILREANSYRKWPNTIFNLVRRYTGKKATAIISNSYAGDKYWNISGYSGEKYIIRNALPYDQINNTKNTFPDIGLSSNENYVLYAGRLNSRIKNIDNLVLALIKIIFAKDVKAVICGEGPYKTRIEKKIKEYSLIDKLLLPGYLEDRLLWTLMRKAKAFIYASKVEGCPNAVLEAMACGCPLVVSDIPEHREFLNESLAWFVDPNSPQDIAEGIKKVLDNPDIARKKAQLAQNKARNWQSIEKMAEEYEKVYYQILKNASRINNYHI